ncbi:Peptidoglycan/xylan/chitin deacetylase, PgdA/CDA1 family [Nonomuraea maritima]|uniref:Peptidoglycan/xylan/chitin deacetylase, PgdA/CDA1 family n=1 Tax=Nonomuraea maritima TaxID=683260 RepID=A0A1G8VC04_9ACTN|nr:polysaccharide deacetylase family protein [Nonomuraea maritima]SDJ63377.1 Peptidoglycan/xylan/chitin deacetylase, PgdA/CDA1 family [Nonomuraea maritima]
MRLWALPVALLTLAGCVSHAAPRRHQPGEEPTEPPGHSAVVLAPADLARRLAAMQSDWPRRWNPGCARLKCVALTFDDGPGRYTGQLLDLLARRGVRATFFVVGERVAADRDGHTVRRIAAEGHELGNHTWDHSSLTALPRHEVTRQLVHTDDLVRQLTGVRMRVMRPPYGATDARVAAESRREGLAQILWNVDTYDWRDRKPVKVAKRAAHARPGSIILMHDIHPSTVKAVPTVLDRLAARGFTFVTVSELYSHPPAPGRTYARF